MDIPEWLKGLYAIVTPVAVWFGKDGWDKYQKNKQLNEEHDEKVATREEIKEDKEVNRVWKLKDELIEELKLQASERNVELNRLREEVKACQTEKGLFAETSGKQAVQLVEMKAELAHAKADVADLEKDLAATRLDLVSRNKRIEHLESSQAGVREAVIKLDAVTPSTT